MEVSANELIHSVTMKVRGLRLMGFRMRAAAFIFFIGAKIAGVQIEIEWTR